MPPSQSPVVLIGVTADRSINFHTALAKSLRQSGIDVHLVSSAGPNITCWSGEVETHILEMERNPNLTKDLKALFNWVKLLKKVRPDILMVGTPKASLLGLLSAKIMRVPVRVYFVHGLRLETTSGLLRIILYLLERLALWCASDVIAVSNSVRDRVLELGLSDKKQINVIGMGSANGIDIAKFSNTHAKVNTSEKQAEVGLKPDLFTVGFVGRMRAEKGLNELRDAVLLLKSSGLKFQVLLVGEPEDSVGQAIVEDLRGQGVHVVAPGRVQDPENFLPMMDIFCLPTYREGLVTVVLEAFAAKIPVVATQVTGVVDLVKNFETGLLVSPQNFEQLAEAMRLLYDDPDLRQLLSEKAFSFVDENFREQGVVEKQRDFLLQLIPFR